MLLLPSIAALTGGGILVAKDYAKKRFSSPEDRYMELYGKDDWEASNMDTFIHCNEKMDQAFKAEFKQRLAAALRDINADNALLIETAERTPKGLHFTSHSNTTIDDLYRKRQGLYIDESETGKIRVVWNHMQTDGVGMWRALRGLFDENPPLVPYKEVKKPPPIVPEILALPSVARRLAWRGKLRKNMANKGKNLYRGLVIWETAAIRGMRHQVGGKAPFNLLTSALAVAEVFERHPNRDRLNVGLTAYFPFLDARNKYTVFLCRVRRGSLLEIVTQLQKQTKSKTLGWGQQSVRSYVLSKIPDRAFGKIVEYYRKQIDVLISSLPVGQKPITVGGMEAVISTHPWELTLPYYFLLMGTRHQIHVSFTSNFEEKEDFLDFRQGETQTPPPF